MARVKYTMKFQYLSNTSGAVEAAAKVGGWSESVYGTDTYSEINFLNLMFERALLLAQGCSIVGQRVAMVDPPSLVRVSQRVVPGQGNKAGYTQDIGQMALTVSCLSNTTANLRRFTLRGLPDARAIEGEYKPNQEYDRLLALYFKRLENFYFRGEILAPVVDIISIAANGAFVLANALGADPSGKKLTILRTRDINGKVHGGKFRVAAGATTTTGTLVGWTDGACVDGKARLLAYDFYQMKPGSFIKERATSRKIGRPGNSFVGRRSTRR